MFSPKCQIARFGEALVIVYTQGAKLLRIQLFTQKMINARFVKLHTLNVKYDAAKGTSQLLEDQSRTALATEKKERNPL